MPRAKTPDSILRFKVGEESYELDMGKLTLAEQSDIEAHFGASITDLLLTQSQLASIYIAMRRKTPGRVTWETAGALTDGDVEYLPDPPTKPKTPAKSGAPSS